VIEEPSLGHPPRVMLGGGREATGWAKLGQAALGADLIDLAQEHRLVAGRLALRRTRVWPASTRRDVSRY
jgi:hypothetical protein